MRRLTGKRWVAWVGFVALLACQWGCQGPCEKLRAKGHKLCEEVAGATGALGEMGLGPCKFSVDATIEQGNDDICRGLLKKFNAE